MHIRHTLLLAAGLSAALAATAAASAPHLPRGEAMLPPTAARLGLSAAHAGAWDAMRADTLTLRTVAREDLAGGARELRVLLDRPAPDLRAFSRASQHKVDAHLAQARALRERQLDLYEALSPDEQARVRAAMAQRLDRLSQLRDRLGGLLDARG